MLIFSEPCISESFFIEALAILPGVHLLRDDVGFFADSAGEEAGVFEDGRADFSEVAAREDAAGGGFAVVPKFCFGRQEVAGAPDGFPGAHCCFRLAAVERPAKVCPAKVRSAMERPAQKRSAMVRSSVRRCAN